MHLSSFDAQAPTLDCPAERSQCFARAGWDFESPEMTVPARTGDRLSDCMSVDEVAHPCNLRSGCRPEVTFRSKLRQIIFREPPRSGRFDEA
jgi:hypothetical protein